MVLPRECSGLYKRGYDESGIYEIQPDAIGSFEVYCDMTTAGGGIYIYKFYFSAIPTGGGGGGVVLLHFLFIARNLETKLWWHEQQDDLSMS